MASSRPPRGIFARLWSLCTRLLVWYSIITLALRCPPSTSDLTDTTPLICRPALQMREVVLPHVRPYYDHYAGPYVEKIQPYRDTLKDRVYNPTYTAGRTAYDKFAAPRVAQARAYGQREWGRIVQPKLDELSDQVYTQYQARLGPYVDQGYSSVTPYLEGARNTATHQYHNVLVPTYQKALPYAQNAYDRSSHFVVQYGVPYTRSAYAMSSTFVLRRIWPPIRILYGRNVEPQLSKIKERLASYRDSKRLEAAVSEMDQSRIPGTTTASSTRGTWATLTNHLPVVGSSSTASSIVSSSSEVPEPINVTEELKRWQTKFARASDQGRDDLARRITVIASNHISHHINGLGAALATELEDVSSSVQSILKTTILSTVEDLPDDASEVDQDNAYHELLTHIRTQGNTIKDKAQELRLWKLNSNNELTTLLEESSSSTLSVLDGIRDLGLQEIGMRWASSDHITYEDWKQYHKLKQTFHDWRETVAAVITENADVAHARTAAEDLEDNGMSIASDAAVELGRLKDVARWKIHAQDASDDFTSRKLPAAAARLGQKIMSKGSSAGSAVTASTSTLNMPESIIQAASSSAESIAALVSSSLSSARDSASSIASDAATSLSDSASSLLSTATHSSSSLSNTVDSSSSSLLAAMSSAASSLSSTILDPSPSPSPPATDQIGSSLSSAAESAASHASSITSVVGASPSKYSAQATIAAGSIASKASARASRMAADAGIIDDPATSNYISAASQLLTSAAGDVIDGASSASEAIRILYESVGTDFTVVTHSVLEKASVVAGAVSASASSSISEVSEAMVSPS